MRNIFNQEDIDMGTVPTIVKNTKQLDAQCLSPFDAHEAETQITQYPGRVHIAGANARYTITTSEKDGDLSGTIPIFVGPGHFGYYDGYQGFAEALATAGDECKTSILIDPPRHQGLESVAPYNLFHPGKLLPDAIHAVTTDVQRKYGIAGVHYVGHSLGGPAVLAATEKHLHDKTGPPVKSVTLLDSAGSTKHNIFTMLARVGRLRKEIGQVFRENPEQIRDMTMYGITNPTRTNLEGLMAARFQLDPDRLRRLGELGINTALMNHKLDPLFPADDVPMKLRNSVDAFCYGAPADAGHLSTHLYPHEVAADVSSVIDYFGYLNE